MFNLFCIRPKGFNIGNDAIFMGMQHFIHQAFGQVVNLISIPATSRYESQAKGGLTAKTIYEINQYGHGVIVGGGNLYENGELEVGMDALGCLEVPLMLFSLSRGRIYNRQEQYVERTDAMPDRVLLALHKQAALSMARDTATFDYLRKIGAQNVQLGGCPTLFLNLLGSTLPPLFARDRGEVLISIRHPMLMNIPLHRQAQVSTDLRAIVDFLRKQGRSDVRLLCHDHRDLAFAASFPDLDYVYTGDIATYLAMLNACSLNITYRLHSALPCFSYGVPTIHISYDERAGSLLETVGLGDWNVDMIRSKNAVAEVIERYHRLREFPGVREQAQSRWQELYGVMNRGFANFAAQVTEYRDRCQGPARSGMPLPQGED